jgi:hypothetical protein
MSAPSTHGNSGRTPGGRFATGNKLGRGNPLAGRAAKIRAELLRASKRGDIREICRKLIDGAKAGDLAFIREWFDRTAGRPTDIVTEERIARMEELLKATRDSASPNGENGHE